MAACEFICVSERHRPGEMGPGDWDCVHLTVQPLNPSVRGRETSAWQSRLSHLKNLCLNLNNQPVFFIRKISCFYVAIIIMRPSEVTSLVMILAFLSRFSSDHKVELSGLAALSLLVIFLLVQRGCSLVSRAALALGLLGVFCYRAAIGNVLFPWQPSNKGFSK